MYHLNILLLMCLSAFAVDMVKGEEPFLVNAALDAQGDCPSDPDPNAYWMSKFLDDVVKGNLPDQAVHADELLPNLRVLAELEQKGYLEAIAKGDMSPEDVDKYWVNLDLKPIIIPAFMPVKTTEQPETLIVVQQAYTDENGIPLVFENIIGEGDGSTGRRKRDLLGNVIEDEEEEEYDEDGNVLRRKKRSTNYQDHLREGTLFAVKRLCVATDNGTIIWPDA